MEAKRILVIGGGLGGLVTANILQRNGYQVTIVEKNTRIGGLLQSFKRKNCIFDTGMHYVGSLDKGQVMYRLFNYLNILDKIQLQRMNLKAYERFKIKDKTYQFPMGWEAFEAQMLEYFPDEKAAIQKYIQTIKEVADYHDLYNLRTPVNFDFGDAKVLGRGVYDFIQSITQNKELQNVLAALNSIYAGKKKKASLYMHAVIHNYYNNSAYQVVGGGEAIAQALSAEFIRQGGTIVLKQKIEKFNFENKHLLSVESKTGQFFKADAFISNMHPAITFRMVDDCNVRKSYKKRILSQENGISAFGIHVKLKESVFPKMDFNFHRYLDDDVWAVDRYDAKSWPREYFAYTPPKEGNMQFTDCFSAYTYMKFDEVKQWNESEIHKRPKEYKEWKQKKAEQLLELMEQDFAGIKDQIEFMEVLTPLSYRDYVNNVSGEMYGIEHDFNAPLKSYIFSQTKVKNLFLTGQNINMHGLLGVSLGSLLTVAEFLDINSIIEDINAL